MQFGKVSLILECWRFFCI